jgi:hypothetical protein
VCLVIEILNSEPQCKCHGSVLSMSHYVPHLPLGFIIYLTVYIQGSGTIPIVLPINLLNSVLENVCPLILSCRLCPILRANSRLTLHPNRLIVSPQPLALCTFFVYLRLIIGKTSDLKEWEACEFRWTATLKVRCHCSKITHVESSPPACDRGVPLKTVFLSSDNPSFYFLQLKPDWHEVCPTHFTDDSTITKYRDR